MAGRLQGKFAIVVGAGQTPGETIGNGRAIALTFAREGAEVMCVDRMADRAGETVALISENGGAAFAHQADITKLAEIGRRQPHDLESAASIACRGDCYLQSGRRRSRSAADFPLAKIGSSRRDRSLSPMGIDRAPMRRITTRGRRMSMKSDE